jgi:hypothetical protein
MEMKQTLVCLIAVEQHNNINIPSNITMSYLLLRRALDYDNKNEREKCARKILPRNAWCRMAAATESNVQILIPRKCARN